MTLLCVPITVHDFAQAIDDATLAKRAGADLVEFRIDEVFSGSGDALEERLALDLCANSPLPCIITCRSAAEGGGYDGPEMDRVSLYERLGTASGAGEVPPRYLDFELASYVASENIRQKINLAVDHPAQLRDLRTSLILSMHDFKGRPTDLTRRLLVAREQEAPRVIKVAYLARSLRDNLELLDLVTESDRPMIALGMGEFGLLSRVLAFKFGAFLTFAALRPAQTTAPGQPTLAEMLDLYRVRSITARTRVFGVVGMPVGHSMSPLVHNAGFARAGFDGVYLPLPIAEGFESLKATLGELIDHPRLDFSGCSVTIPHKENLVRLARESGWALDELSQTTGAANTVTVERDAQGRAARVRVSNTDIPAAVGVLEECLGALAGLEIAIVGAGGVARGIALGCARAGAHVTVYNRTRERAEALARDLTPHAGAGSVRAEGLEMLKASRARALVNATPAGMASGPAAQESALPEHGLASKEVLVFDTVYNPIRTPTLARAEALGYATADGVGMFVRQAAMQFEGWTGASAPIAEFDRLVRARLAPKASGGG
ncbi:MAG: type I 3-dehydroquinate dehydratase [Planctomycetota bacterium]|nr:type I 3-dehydroquinate dehydratase [Planctomycetota bacterium]